MGNGKNPVFGWEEMTSMFVIVRHSILVISCGVVPKRFSIIRYPAEFFDERIIF